jgi:hypothetical protein
MLGTGTYALAIRAYLQHSLAFAVKLLTALKLEHDTSDRRIHAAQKWAECVNRALTVCGVYGLVAVDRSEGHILHCMKTGQTIGKHSGPWTHDLSVVYDFSVTSYTQALECWKTGDPDLVALWLHVGSCVDRVITLRPDKVRRNGYFDCSPDLLSLESQIFAKLHTSQENKVFSIKERQLETAQQHSRAQRYFSRAAAYAILDHLVGSYTAVFPESKEVQRTVVHRGTAAYAAGKCMELGAKYSTDAARAAEGSPLKALWQLVLNGFEAAATALAPWDLTLDRDQQLGQRRRIDDSARFLAATATSLVPVVAQYDEQCAVIQASAGATWLQETGDILANVFKQIHESPLVAAMLGADDAPAPSMEEKMRLSALVTAVKERFELGDSKQIKTEQTVARYLALSNSVNKTLSPAHPHIAECWQKAALHLSISCETPNATSDKGSVLLPYLSVSRSARPSREKLLERCSKVFANVAAGTFTETAAYFLKAQRAASREGRELWLGASDWLLKAGLEHVKVVETAIEMYPSLPGEALQSSTAGNTYERCAYSCAEAAAVAEKQHGQGELKGMELKLCMAMVQLEKQSAAPEINEFSLELGSLRALVRNVRTLVRVQEEPEPHLDTSHLAHLRPAANPEEGALRRQRTHWLCDAATALSDLACEYGHNPVHRTTQVFREALRSSHMVQSLVAGTAITFDEEIDEDMGLQGITHEPDACGRVQLVGLRYIEAVRAQLAGRMVACTMWRTAAREEFSLSHNVAGGAGADVVLQFCSALGDRLAVAAWQLGDKVDDIPVSLLSPYEPSDGFPCRAHVDTAAQADVEQAAHVFMAAKKPVAVITLHRRAAEQFGWAAEFTKLQVVATATQLEPPTDTYTEVASRAMQCGRRLAQAVTALEEGQAEAAKLYVRAADLSAVCSTSHAKPNIAEAQPVADKAGDRFEEAARALVAGDQLRHLAWLRAAEATAELLQVTVTKSTKRQNIALAAGYTAQKLAQADALATQAAAHPVAASTTGAAAVGSKRKGQNAPEKPQGMRRRKG